MFQKPVAVLSFLVAVLCGLNIVLLTRSTSAVAASGDRLTARQIDLVDENEVPRVSLGAPLPDPRVGGAAPRLRLRVDADGAGHVEVLDDDGSVVRALR